MTLRIPRIVDFVGKTIVAIDVSSINMWCLQFGDGTSVGICAEPIYLGGATLSELSVEDDLSAENCGKIKWKNK